MAFVQKQMVPVQFGGGIDTKVDPKQLQAGQLLELENGQFSKTSASDTTSSEKTSRAAGLSPTVSSSRF
jgi:hypothetical protein